VLLARVGVDRAAASADISRLAASARRDERAAAEALGAALGEKRPDAMARRPPDAEHPDNSCSTAFYAGAAAWITGHGEIAFRSLDEASRVCPRGSWEYLCSVGMLHRVKR
jgi:hypothetical protein